MSHKLSSGKGAKVAPIQTTFDGKSYTPGWIRAIVKFVTAPPVNKNGTKAVAVVRGTGLGIVNGKQTIQVKPGPGGGGNGGGGDGSAGDSTYPVRTSPSGVKFNLPPHSWSLPVNQQVLNSNNKDTGDYTVTWDPTTGLSVRQKALNHSLRRAIMWSYLYGDIDNKKYTLENKPADYSSLLATAGATSPLDTNWGFQFLWNPEAIGNSLSRNANFTPSAVDKTAKFASIFTSMEAVSFSIVIDRVNDFACIKSSSDYANIANTYYRGNGYPGNPEDIVEQLRDLSKRGTMADIEYIFRMINGEGTNGSVWKNPLGRQTADLGFLSPSVIAVQFGPNKDSLSYVGYVEGITISHNKFTEDMIPIHSEVNVSFVAYARTSLSQK
jgi:hypothetical protein